MTDSGEVEKVVLRREDLTSQVAAALIRALNAELSGRYQEQGTTHFALDPDEVAEGNGAFRIAYAGTEAVGCRFAVRAYAVYNLR